MKKSLVACCALCALLTCTNLRLVNASSNSSCNICECEDTDPSSPTFGTCINVGPDVTLNLPSVCSGSPSAVSAGVTGGTSPYSYDWQSYGGGSNPGNVDSFSTTSAGYYKVVVTDANNCQDVDASYLTFYTSPTCTVSPSGTIVCQGQSVSFSATASGGGGSYTYEWTKPGGSTSSGSSLTIANAGTADVGDYACIATDSHNCHSASASGTLCLPAGETTSIASTGLPFFKGTLTPGSCDFTGKHVIEGDASPGFDGCHFFGSALLPQESVTGGDWTVSGSDYCCDDIRWEIVAVNYYRAHSRAPCEAILYQKMTVQGCSTPYKFNTLRVGIGTSDHWAYRDGEGGNW